MKIEFSYVDFFKPIFSQGKNFGNKVNAKQHNAKLVYDTDTRLMSMVYKNHVLVHSGDFAGDVIDPASIGIEVPKQVVSKDQLVDEHAAIKLSGKNKSQRSSPTMQGE